MEIRRVVMLLSISLALITRPQIFQNAPRAVNSISQLFESPAYENSGVFMAADDLKNPLFYWSHQPIFNNVKIAADMIIGPGVFTDHQKAVKLMEFINTIPTGIATESTLQGVVLGNRGDCGTFSMLFLSLAITQNIPGRYIALHNYPYHDGHTAVELWIDQKWSVYDPTYDMYFTRTSGNVEHPDILSFAELRSGLGYTSTQIIGNQARAYPDGIHISPFATPDIYVFANPAGVSDPGNPLVFPLYMDPVNTARISSTDVNFISNNQGAWMLGALAQNISQELTISGLRPGRAYNLNIVYQYRGLLNFTEDPFKAYAVAGPNAKILLGDEYLYYGSLQFGSRVNSPWMIYFFPFSDVIKIKLTHNYTFYNYLLADSYQLIEIPHMYYLSLVLR